MSPDPRSPRRMRPAALLLAAALAVFATATGVRAESNTKMADSSGEFSVQAPGKWFKEPTADALKASGFLGNYRCEILAVIYPDVAEAPAAATKWIGWRKAKKDKPSVASFKGDKRRWISRSGRGTLTEYARAVQGVGRTAVIWLRIERAAGEVDDEAFAVLDTARFKVEQTSKRKVDVPGEAEPQFTVWKDAEHRVELQLPKGSIRNRDVKPDFRRVVSVIGPIGDDPEAYMDLYAFPDFARPEAAGWWWHSKESRGWNGKSVVEGEPPVFRVLKEGETWNRLVKIVPTPAGIFGLKIDVESTGEKAALRMLEAFKPGGSLKILKSIPVSPSAPQGFKTLESQHFFAFTEGDQDAAQKVLNRALAVDKSVEELLGFEAWGGRKGVLRVYSGQESYDVAVRLAGGEKGTPAHWSPSTGIVLTHAESLESLATREQAVFEMAKEAVHRRFGFRPPFWIEHGVSHVVASSIPNRGRTDQPYEVFAEGVKDAAGGSLEFEQIRWWETDNVAGNQGTESVAWGFAFFFLEGSALSKTWEPAFREYLSILRETCRRGQASAAFPFAKDPALVIAWKKRMGKL